MNRLCALLCLPAAALAGACLDSTPAGVTDAALGSSDATGTNTQAPDPDTSVATHEHDPDTTETHHHEDDTSVATHEPDTATPVCESDGDMCMSNGECCEGHFCGGGPYIYGECMAKQPKGAPCNNDRWCESGLCQDGVCAVAGCSAEGVGCDGNGECCSGNCQDGGYGPRFCGVRSEVGSYCEAPEWCRSGLCVEGQCARKCQADTENCLYDGDCCDGFTCTGPGGTCEVRKCENTGAEVDCWDDFVCCSGACSYDGMTYNPGRCIDPLPAGQPCARASWCQSGYCIDGVCE